MKLHYLLAVVLATASIGAQAELKKKGDPAATPKPAATVATPAPATPAPAHAAAPAPAPKTVAKPPPAPVAKPIVEDSGDEDYQAEVKVHKAQEAAAAKKAKDQAEAKRKAESAKLESDTLAWMDKHPLDLRTCGEKTGYSRISHYKKGTAPAAVKAKMDAQLANCRAERDKILAAKKSAPSPAPAAAAPKPTESPAPSAAQSADPAPAGESQGNQAGEKTTTAKVTESAGAMWDKFKTSVKNGQTESVCTDSERAFNRCH